MKFIYKVTFLTLLNVLRTQASDDNVQFDNRFNSSESCSESLVNGSFSIIENSTTTDSVISLTSEEDMLEPSSNSSQTTQDIVNVISINSTSECGSNKDDIEMVEVKTNQTEGDNIEAQNATLSSESGDVLTSHEALCENQNNIPEVSTNTNSQKIQEERENTTEVWTLEDSFPDV